MFAWIVVLSISSTNELLQFLRPDGAFSPGIFSKCQQLYETHTYLFLHCEMAWKWSTRLLDMFGLAWVIPPSVECLMSFCLHGDK